VNDGFFACLTLDKSSFTFEEFEHRVKTKGPIFPPAPPGPDELTKSGAASSTLIRPTGLVRPPKSRYDAPVKVSRRPAGGNSACAPSAIAVPRYDVDHAMAEIFFEYYTENWRCSAYLHFRFAVNRALGPASTAAAVGVRQRPRCIGPIILAAVDGCIAPESSSSPSTHNPRTAGPRRHRGQSTRAFNALPFVAVHSGMAAISGGVSDGISGAMARPVRLSSSCRAFRVLGDFVDGSAREWTTRISSWGRPLVSRAPNRFLSLFQFRGSRPRDRRASSCSPPALRAGHHFSRCQRRGSCGPQSTPKTAPSSRRFETCRAPPMGGLSFPRCCSGPSVAPGPAFGLIALGISWRSSTFRWSRRRCRPIPECTPRYRGAMSWIFLRVSGDRSYTEPPFPLNRLFTLG